MSQIPHFRTSIALLLAGGILFPIAICLILGVGAMLTAMGDASGGVVLNRISLAFAILWVLDLIALVLFQGLHFLLNNRKDSDPPDEL
jgi:hypothetical protein